MVRWLTRTPRPAARHSRAHRAVQARRSLVASSGRRYDTLRWLFEPVADKIDYVASLAHRSIENVVSMTRGFLVSFYS